MDVQVPPEISNRLSRKYPRPRIDPEWLSQCYEWVISEHPDSSIDDVVGQIEIQFLESNLSDSTLPGTGLPPQITDGNTTKTVLSANQEVLVEITSMTDVGVSAYNLNKTRTIREERFASGYVEGEEEQGEVDPDVEDEGPIPPYQRSMLKLELSDGSTSLRAVEHKPLAILALGVTPLGFKMRLKGGLLIRRGLAFLDQEHVEMLGHKTEEREERREFEFQRGLHQRLGLPLPDQPAPAPVVAEQRVPLRELTPPPAPPEDIESTLVDGHGSPRHEEDAEQPRRRKLPGGGHLISQTERSQAPPSASGSTIVASPFFSSSGGSNGSVPAPSSSSNGAGPSLLGAAIELSPTRRQPETQTQPKSKSRSDSPDFSMQSGDEFDYAFEDDDFQSILHAADEHGPQRQQRQGSTAPRLTQLEPVVISDSDEEEEDGEKENVPAARRSVKRKITRQQPPDVIEID